MPHWQSECSYPCGYPFPTCPTDSECSYPCGYPFPTCPTDRVSVSTRVVIPSIHAPLTEWVFLPMRLSLPYMPHWQSECSYPWGYPFPTCPTDRGEYSYPCGYPFPTCPTDRVSVPTRVVIPSLHAPLTVSVSTHVVIPSLHAQLTVSVSTHEVIPFLHAPLTEWVFLPMRLSLPYMPNWQRGEYSYPCGYPFPTCPTDREVSIPTRVVIPSLHAQLTERWVFLPVWLSLPYMPNWQRWVFLPVWLSLPYMPNWQKGEYSYLCGYPFPTCPTDREVSIPTRVVIPSLHAQLTEVSIPTRVVIPSLHAQLTERWVFLPVWLSLPYMPNWQRGEYSYPCGYPFPTCPTDRVSVPTRVVIPSLHAPLTERWVFLPMWLSLPYMPHWQRGECSYPCGYPFPTCPTDRWVCLPVWSLQSGCLSPSCTDSAATSLSAAVSTPSACLPAPYHQQRSLQNTNTAFIINNTFIASFLGLAIV